MSIALSPAALERARRFLAASPDALGLRFGVSKTGCSGWGYVVDLAHDEQPGDSISEQDGVRIFVDAKSQTIVDGTEIDFAQKGLNQEFVFRNPNAAAECGCGESFTTDPSKAL